MELTKTNAVQSLSKGNKKTEVGVIPEDWFNIKLNSIIDPKRTIRYGIVQPGKFDPNGKFLIRGQDYSNGWVAEELFFRVSPQIEEPYKNARVIEGDVIITIVGASTGHIEIIPKWLDGSNLTQTTARLAIDSNKAINQYVRYYLSSEKGKEQVANYIKGAAQPGLNCGDIEKFIIPLPPTLTEQKAIATALSDVDALISSLDKLITKKKAIKQGAMQELLTPPHKGGKRLPGFSGEWEENQLGELCSNISSGSSNTTSITGIFPLYGSTGQIGTKDYNDYSGDRILVARVGANAGSLYKVIGDYCVSDNTLMLSVCKEIDINFLFFLLKKYNLTKLIFGSGQPLVTGGQLKEILLFLPKKEEQKTISQILTDIDLEIESLENKKAKYQEVKQGMMQELLTGKTRLV